MMPLGHSGSVASSVSSVIDHRSDPLTIGQGAVERLLIVSVDIERVGNARPVGLDQLVIERIVESLSTSVSCLCLCWSIHTGPVRTC